MLRTSVCLVALLLVAGAPHAALAQSTAPAPVATTAAHPAKPSRIKLTVERLKEMRAKWVQNKPKLRACRAQVRSRGLTGDDRWFFIEECMDKG